MKKYSALKKVFAVVLAVAMLASMSTIVLTSAAGVAPRKDGLPEGKTLADTTFFNNTYSTQEEFNYCGWGDGSSYDAEVGHDAKGSVKLSRESYAARYVWMKLEKGTEYFISFYAKGEKGKTFSVDLEGNAGVPNKTFTFADTDKWELFTLTMKPTAQYQNDGFPFRYYTQSSATMWCDDLQITPVVGGAEPDPLVNLETVIDSKATYVLFDAKKPEKEGSWAYSSVGFAAAMTANKTYLVSFDMMTNNLKLTAAFDYGTGADVKWSHNDEINKWEKMSFEYTPTKDTTSVRIYENVKDNAQFGMLAIDNIKVAEKDGGKVLFETNFDSKADLTFGGGASYKAPKADTDVGNIDWSTTEGSFKMVSAEIINESQIKITFTEPIASPGTKGREIFSALRIVDENCNLYKNDEWSYFQYGGKFTFNGSKEVIYTWSAAGPFQTLADAINVKGFEGKGLFATICFEDLPSSRGKNPTDTVGFLDGCISEDGNLLCAMNIKKNAKGEYDGMYVPITGKENLSIECEEGKVKKLPYVEVVSATCLDAIHIQLKFSEPVVKVDGGRIFTAVRYTKDEKAVAYDDGKPLQFTGGLAINGTDSAIWTYDAADGTPLSDIFAMKGYENDKSLKLRFCIEGLPMDGLDQQMGYIDTVTSVDGKKLLLATAPSSNGIYDGLYINITGQENAEKGSDVGVLDGVTVDEIYAKDEFTLKIKFSEAVYLIGDGTAQSQNMPLVAAIRCVDKTTYATLTLDGQKLEFPGKFDCEDGSDIGTFTLNSTKYTLKELFEKKGFENVDGWVVLYLEGTPDNENIPSPQMGYVDNVRNKPADYTGDDVKFLVGVKFDMSGIADAYMAFEDEIELKFGSDEPFGPEKDPDDEKDDEKKDDEKKDDEKKDDEKKDDEKKDEDKKDDEKKDEDKKDDETDTKPTKNNTTTIIIIIVVVVVVLAAAAAIYFFVIKKKK